MRRFLATLLLVAKVANGECRNVGPDVVCDKPGFDKLVDRCVGFDAAAKTCALRLDAAKAQAEESKKALDACIASIPPPPKKPSALRPALGYAAGVIGAVALTAALAADLDTGNRVLVGAAGVVGVGVGVAFVLP
jgi:hypothetical protein